MSPGANHPLISQPPITNGLAAQDWTPASPADVCLAFLRGEWEKVPQITAWHDRHLVDSPDLASHSENSLRRFILGAWREPLLQQIPGDTRWHRVRFLQDAHLDELLVIASSDWVDQRDRNELRKVAARRPQTLRLPPTDWTQPILWSHDRAGPFSILEGNNRLTGYSLTPSYGPLRVECFVGLSPSRCVWHLPDHGQ